MSLFSRFTRPAWERARAKAEKAARGGDPAAALRAYDSALSSAPDSERGALEAARAEVVAELYRENVALAASFEGAGQASRALDHYEVAKGFAPGPSESAEVEAAIARLTQERRAAEDAKIAPEMTQPMQLDDDQSFGVLIGALPDAAADEYEEQDAAFRAAFMAMHRGELDAAIAHFTVAAETGNPAALAELGRCLRGEGRFADALDAFAAAEAARPEWNFVRLLAAEAAIAAGDLDRADDVLQRAVDFDDADPNVYVAICQSSIRRGDPSFGLDAAEAGLDVAPTHRGLFLLRARLYEMAGREDEALAGYEKRVQETWRYDAQEGKLFLDYDAAFLAAHLYRRRGVKPERAAELFRGLLAVSPPEERWQHELGLADVLTQAGKQGEAEPLLAELSRVIPAEQRGARCRVAALQGDTDAVAALVADMSDVERAAWDAAEAERAAR